MIYADHNLRGSNRLRHTLERWDILDETCPIAGIIPGAAEPQHTTVSTNWAVYNKAQVHEAHLATCAVVPTTKKVAILTADIMLQYISADYYNVSCVPLPLFTSLSVNNTA